MQSLVDPIHKIYFAVFGKMLHKHVSDTRDLPEDIPVRTGPGGPNGFPGGFPDGPNQPTMNDFDTDRPGLAGAGRGGGRLIVVHFLETGFNEQKYNTVPLVVPDRLFQNSKKSELAPTRPVICLVPGMSLAAGELLRLG